MIFNDTIVSEPSKIAEEMNDHFINKMKNMHKELKGDTTTAKKILRKKRFFPKETTTMRQPLITYKHHSKENIENKKE